MKSMIGPIAESPSPYGQMSNAATEKRALPLRALRRNTTALGGFSQFAPLNKLGSKQDLTR